MKDQNWSVSDRWALSQTWRKRGTWGDEEATLNRGSGSREVRKVEGKAPPMWRMGRMLINIEVVPARGEVSWVSNGWGVIWGRIGCCQLSDEPTLKLYQENPVSL